MTGTPIVLPLRPYTPPADVEARCTAGLPVYACDFYVDGAERGAPEPGGLRIGRILNVDHHAPVARMQAPVTSTLLAAELLAERGTIEPSACVVVNHTDCDSMLSSAILLGELPPDASFVAASVRADHTGEADPVADLLQGLDGMRHGTRTAEQYAESLRNLRSLLNGEPIEPMAAVALERREVRRAASQAVVSGGVEWAGALAVVRIETEIDSAFFPALLPEAALIMIVRRDASGGERWSVKLRLGAAAPHGITLHSLRIREWDAEYGGRWNAGSNKRGGGTALTPEDYAARLRASLDALGDPLRWR